MMTEIIAAFCVLEGILLPGLLTERKRLISVRASEVCVDGSSIYSYDTKEKSSICLHGINQGSNEGGVRHGRKSSRKN